MYIPQGRFDQNSNSPPMKAVYGEGQVGFFNYMRKAFDGDKFPGGFGVTKNYVRRDLYIIRARSKQLFTENPYAVGIINRLVTNVIGTGLNLDVIPPKEFFTSVKEERTYTAKVLDTFNLFTKNKQLCSVNGLSTFGQIQSEVYRQALISGDVLILLRQNKSTKLPSVEVIDGSRIKSPLLQRDLESINKRGNILVDGVEIDKFGKHVAFYVSTLNPNTGMEEIVRIKKFGFKSKRLTAWLVFGQRQLTGDVRGIPLLSSILQNLKELDRYRDAEIRAAGVNATFVAYVKKTQDRIGTRPFTNGAIQTQVTPIAKQEAEIRNINLKNFLPGSVFDELGYGEEIELIDTKRPNVNFGAFEQATLTACAWSLQIPPEVLFLSYTSNFSSSRAAINEFKVFTINKQLDFSSDFNKLYFKEWITNLFLSRQARAPQFIQAFKNKNFLEQEKWFQTEWIGNSKPSVDPLKDTQAAILQAQNGFISMETAARNITGTKFETNIDKLKEEVKAISQVYEDYVDVSNVRKSITDNEAPAQNGEENPVQNGDEDGT